MIGVRKKLNSLLCTLLCLTAMQLQAKEERYPTDNSSTQTSLAVHRISEAVDGLYTDLLNEPSIVLNKEVAAYVEFAVDPATLYLEKGTFDISLEVDVVVEYFDAYSFPPRFISSDPERVVLNITYDPNGVSKHKAFMKFPNAHKITATIAVAPAAVLASTYLKTEVVIDRYYTFDRFVNGSINTPNHDANTNLITVDWEAIDHAEEYDLEWVHLNNYDSDGTTISASNFNIPADVFKNASRISTKETNYSLPLVFDKGFVLFRYRAKGRMFSDNAEGLYEGIWSTHNVTFSTVDVFNNYFEVGTSEAHELDKNWMYQAAFTEDGKNKYVLNYVDGAGKSRQTVVNQNDKKEVVVSETYYDYQGRPAVSALPAPVAPVSPSTQASLKFYQHFNTNDEATPMPYGKEDFDVDLPSDCETETKPFATATFPSAGNYYSSDNPAIALNEDMYVPSAGGYPFSQSFYTPDNTGRIRSSTIPGEHFKHSTDGTGHDNKFIYATPYQEELDALFGSNVGLAYKYKKNVSIDANEQISISYINPADQTIATALYGEAPDNLETLESYATSQETIWVDLLGKQLAEDPVGLMEKFDYAKGTRELSRVIPVLKKDYLEFDYEIEGEVYDHACKENQVTQHYCYDCVLDLEVSLKDNCNVEYLAGIDGATSNSIALGDHVGLQKENCNDLPDESTNYHRFDWYSNDIANSENQIDLEVGSYNLGQKLSINFEKLDAYTNDFIANNECLKSEEDMQAEELDKLELLNDCDYDCAQCISDLGVDYLSSDFYIGDPDCDPCLTEAEYDRLKEECNETCEGIDKCRGAYQSLVADMSPGGQYGLTRKEGQLTLNGRIGNSSSVVEPWKFPLSIFNVNNKLPRRTLDNSQGAKHHAFPSWRKPLKLTADGVLDDANPMHYLDANGEASKIYPTLLANGDYEPPFIGSLDRDIDGNDFVYPENLVYVEDFLKNWKASWAKQLVAYHPEYGYYQYCVLMNLSNDFDDYLYEADDLEGMPNTTYRNAIVGSESDHSFFESIDPFFSLSNPYGGNAAELDLLQEAMLDKLENYTIKVNVGQADDVLSIWDLVWKLTNCEDPNSQCNIACDQPVDFDIDNEMWAHFRGLYLSAKQQIMNKHYTEKSISSNHPNTDGYILASYNECIGKPYFNKYKNDFLTTILVRNPNAYNPVINWFKKLAAYITVSSKTSQYFNPGQACNKISYRYYARKEPRFGDHFSYSSVGDLADEADCDKKNKYSQLNCDKLNEVLSSKMEKKAQAQRFKQCGQCPLAFDLELLINGIIKDETYDLTTTTGFAIECNIPELSNELNSALSTGGESTEDPPNVDLTWTNIGTPSNIIIDFGECDLILGDIQSLGIDYDDVTSICCLRAGSNPEEFEFTISYPDPLNPEEELEAVVIGSSCIDLMNCDFGQECKLTSIGFEVQDLLNSLNSNSDLFQINANGVKLDYGYHQAVVSNSIIEHLSERQNASLTNRLKWETTVSNNTALVAKIFANGSVPACDFTLNKISGPSAINEIVYFYNIRVVESAASPYQFLISGKDALGKVHELEGTSCIKMAECKPYLDDPFLSSFTIQTVKNCATTPLFDLISDDLKSNGTISITNGVASYVYNGTIPNPTCNLQIEIIDSEQDVNLIQQLEVLETFIIEEDNEPNKMYALVSLCDITDPTCEYPTAIVSILSDCSPLYTCQEIDPSTANSDCELYDVVEEVEERFEAYFASNFNTLVEANDKYLLSGLVPGCDLYLHKGIKFDNVFTDNASDDLSLEKKEVPIKLNNAGTMIPNIVRLHNFYVQQEPNANGFLLSAYLVAELNDGSLASFKLETDEDCAFGKCGDCFTTNLLINGDFEFEAEVINLSFNPDFDATIGNTGPVQSRNYMNNDLTPIFPGNNEAAYYGIVSYSNYFQHIKVNPLGPTPFWVGCTSSPIPTVGTHSPISTAASESMTGNFLLAKVAAYSNEPDEFTIWKDEKLNVNPSMSPKNYVFTFDVMAYVDALGLDYTGCLPQISVNINNQAYDLHDFKDNLYESWKEKQSIKDGCTSGPPNPNSYQYLSDRWNIDWKQIEIPFTTSEIDITVEIRIKQRYNNPLGGSCNVGESIFWGFDNIALRAKPCNTVLSPNLCHPKPFATVALEDLLIPCQDQLEAKASYAAKIKYKLYIDSVKQAFREGYIQKCLNSYQDFSLKHKAAEHHFTLYYYDQAGNLVRTVPPKGVEKLDATERAKARADRGNNKKSQFTEHTLATTYTYNSLGQLVKQQVPDHNSLDLFSAEPVSNLNTGLPSNFKARDVAFSSSQVGVAVGFINLGGGSKQGQIYRTENGGFTWQKTNSLGIDDYNHICPEKHIVGDHGSLMVYENNEWNRRTPPTNENLIHVTTGQTSNDLIILSENGRSWRSTDLGMTWMAVNNQLKNKLRGKVTHYDFDAPNNKGLAVSDQGEIFYTGDLGLNWHKRSHISADHLNTVSNYGGKFFAAGEAGNIVQYNSGTHTELLGSSLVKTILKIHATSATNYFAIAQESSTNELYYTKDGGTTWQNSNLDVKDFSFVNQQIGYALTENELFKTGNGGNIWTLVATLGANFTSFFQHNGDFFIGKSNGEIEYNIAGTAGTTSSLAALEIKEMSIDATLAGKGVALIGDDIYTSNNIGAPAFSTWTWNILTAYSTEKFVDMHAVDFANIYAITDQGKLIYSDDGGVNWTEKANLQFAASSVNEFQINSTTGAGLIVGDNGLLWTSSDGGTTWTDKTAKLNINALNGVAIDANTGNSDCYAVGDKGVFLKSEDQGFKWKVIDAGTKYNLNDLEVDNGTGLIAGDNVVVNIQGGTMSTAVPSAKSYTDLVYDAPDFYLLNSFAVDKYNNTGTSFETKAFEDGLLGNAIVKDGMKLVVVGNSGQILENPTWTDPAWSNSNTFEPEALYSVQAINSTTYIAGGASFYLSMSKDAGKTWKLFDDPASTLASADEAADDIYFTDETHGMFVSKDGRAYSYNPTDRWEALAITGGDLGSANSSKKLYQISMLNTQTGIIAAKNVLYYTDTGIEGTWKEVDNSKNISHTSTTAHFVDNDLAYVGGTAGKIIKVTRLANGDLRADLELERALEEEQIRAIYFTDKKRGYAVGFNGHLSITSDGGAAWIDKGLITDPGINLFALDFSALGKGVYLGEGGTFGTITDFSEYYSDRFYYDKLGRIIASQNAKQYALDDNVYSYTLYDELGRIAEVGELQADKIIDVLMQKGLIDQTVFEAWVEDGVKSEISRTHYDKPLNCALGLNQENLRARVSSSTYQVSDDSELCDYDHATHYSYDVHGNVKSIYQEFPELEYLNQSLKRIDYEYDLISGNVKKVLYQQGAVDQFFHKYEYDSDNRIVGALTSTDGEHWVTDANYEYYRHGPLKRTQLGEWEVQGMDYAYTIQGWLKGVNSNSMRPDHEMGRDGITSSTNHSEVAKDAYGFNLGYYEGDYTSIGSPTHNFEASITGSYVSNKMNNLYNGNIAYMTTSFTDDVSHAAGPQAMIYQYDQLNRIKGATSYTGMATNGTAWNASSPADKRYNTSYSYDAMGNLMSLGRRNETGEPMDSLAYKYHHTSMEGQDPLNNWGGRNTNRLLAVEDEIDNGTSGNDIKNNQAFDNDDLAENNYTYDAIGNLKSDKQEKIEEIEWTASGKIKRIIRKEEAGVGQSDLEFFYDAMGNRIRKITKPRDASDGSKLGEDQWTETIYVRDAQGNVLSTYTKAYEEDAVEVDTYIERFTQSELNLFGSDRLGMYQRNQDLVAYNFTASQSSGVFETKTTNSAVNTALVDEGLVIKGLKNYELKNHLGNVLAVITDSKKPSSNVINSNVFTEDFENDGLWETSAQADLDFINGEMLVTVNKVGHGITRSLSVSPESGCTFNYCFSIKDPFPTSLNIVTIGGGFTYIPVTAANMCIPIDVSVVTQISFVLTNISAGNEFTVESAYLEKSCPTSILTNYEPILIQRQDYYPFGMPMDARGITLGNPYRFGFQGQEKDDEIKGSGNSLNYKYRMHDARIGRFFAVDPLTYKYPFYSPYAFSGNRVIDMIELEGLEPTSFDLRQSRRERAVLSGAMSSEQFLEQAKGEAFGAVMGLAAVATFFGGEALIPYFAEWYVASTPFITSATLTIGQYGPDAIGFAAGLGGYDGDIPGASGDEIAKALRVGATKFYGKFAKYGERGVKYIKSHVDAIDFSKDVSTRILEKGTKLYQWTIDGKVTGDYFAKSASDVDLGLPQLDGVPAYFDEATGALKKRTLVEVTLSTDVEVLESTAGNANSWIPEVKETFKGGSSQIFSPEIKDKIE